MGDVRPESGREGEVPEESYEQIEHHPAPAQGDGEADFSAAEPESRGAARVRAASERKQQSEEDEFQFHTGTVRPSGAPDAIEFVDVHKSFGRNHVLRGLNTVSYTHLRAHETVL